MLDNIKADTNAFSCMDTIGFQIKFHRIMFLMDYKPTLLQTMACRRANDKSLSAWINDDIVYWHLYAPSALVS